ncbi:M14 family zinc carboxypeptidase [Psychroserpens sp.]|uniref:M14 family zinc carboxypeptidase n=1 Tax=Psychroserpens sp. TaxID=2020870 RepID=UPI001B17931D|nr:M14 family zinc carboxypeptidase [Psychroserpens sp.]MBO6606531.1 peptidase M14 [Psychroserpens sp.]MBO6631808.1 peptidase M14 [Psychroserpens sp.]MBO6653235.1 peptidase M14 [Psychroserpens sp.]MBO6680738.1 peptidase M14 [Psychroserpens sp.]MBO6750304.1 peptidase M14 [Psychroserpens sp.]
MLDNALKNLHKTHKELTLTGRYIHHKMISPLLSKLPSKFKVEEVGKSVENNPIHSVTFGHGSKKILMWSQMHGNESTTTKAVFDLFNTFSSESDTILSILDSCCIKIIPILNPDGAKVYTRINANAIDLNRDAQDRSQPESQVLRDVFNEFKPDYCFNLHGQRTIFSAGNSDHPATVSFLAPSQDLERSVTKTRKKAMEIIVKMNEHLQKEIPNQVGIYDDSFNLNCVGDTFQSLDVPTVLFEAGHFQNDYRREETRRFIFESLMVAIAYISETLIAGEFHASYFEIPKNEKRFYDIIIRNAAQGAIAIQFQEQLIANEVHFMPKIKIISNLNSYYSHKSINARGFEVFGPNNASISVGNEIDFVIVNNEKFSLFP